MPVPHRAWQVPQDLEPIIYTDNGHDLRQYCANLKATDYAIYRAAAMHG